MLCGLCFDEDEHLDCFRRKRDEALNKSGNRGKGDVRGGKNKFRLWQAYPIIDWPRKHSLTHTEIGMLWTPSSPPTTLIGGAPYTARLDLGFFKPVDSFIDSPRASYGVQMAPLIQKYCKCQPEKTSESSPHISRDDSKVAILHSSSAASTQWPAGEASPAMWNSRAPVAVLLAALLYSVALVPAQGSSPWKTLTGDPPFVVARGGFSGLFPGFSSAAYNLALITSVQDVVLYCDVQLTKDGAGICFPDLLLNNNSNVDQVFVKKEKTYPVNGVRTKGWFSIDYTLKDLANVFVTQGVYSRANSFDANMYPILTVEDVAKQFAPPALWLNIENNMFFAQHNLSMRNYVLSVSKKVVINFISSPEVAFLNSFKARVSPSTTNLVFKFLDEAKIEPSTNQTYGSLSKNLTFIKTFASGIIVPKTYIWPVTMDNYLEPHTSIVSDAHKAGLTVFVSGFFNDVPFPFNYSYDPVSEYLSFFDNNNFSVDGVLSDFPITPSAAIDCYAHPEKNASVPDAPLVISKDGASGDYPGCTYLAYMHAIEDGVDVLDCNVQMSKDGIPFCSSTINLIDSTAVAQSRFNNYSMVVPEIKVGSGIYTFSLTWDQIKTLKPSILSPQRSYTLFRNPRFKSAGSYLNLSEFLTMAKNSSSLSGVLISIEYAAYLAEKKGLSVTDAVITELNKAGYGNQTKLDVMIQSTNSSVLMKFKEETKYKCVYKIEEKIGDALEKTVEDIKKFANAVVVNKASVFPENQAFITRATDVVKTFQGSEIPVYVELFSNEFVSQAWDFFSDSSVEINSYVTGAGVDGVITDFPKTAARYKRNRCLSYKVTPAYMSPVQAGSLVQVVSPVYLPPAEAPNPVLTESDVIEPPLPAAKIALAPGPSSGSTVSPPPLPNGQPKNAVCFLLSTLAMLSTSLFLL
ncbi:glycerophosphodiester phosphodiesterase GDPDL3-like [Argentina anserina]|uniref:glycerophosphodiester phosphodiesterase GDPDL3-like n=1 Tax=Argentina anserina TaxID=57926 RepID=UPI0021763F51|nr:glycerophosphodiester phosphodiesterase GDPDL3-like [Potentilla anserina]